MALLCVPTAGLAGDDAADCPALTRLAELPGRGSYICAQGGLLFLTRGAGGKEPGGGCGFDLRGDRAAPRLLWDSLPAAWDIAVGGENAYVCDYTRSLRVYRIEESGWTGIATLPMPSQTENVILRGDLAYVACHTAGLVIVDVAQPQRPAIVGRLDPGIDCDAIALMGRIALLYDHWGGRLICADLADPRAPRQVGIYRHPTPFAQGEMAVDGPNAYCAAGANGLVIVNVEDPAAPRLVKTLTLDGSVGDVAVLDGRAFVAAGVGGVRVFDVSDPAAAFAVGFYRDPENLAATQLAVGPRDGSGAYPIYVANGKGQAMVLAFHPREGR